MDYVLLFFLYALVYAQGKNPYMSAIVFGALIFGIQRVLDEHKKKENVRKLTGLFKKALYENVE
jgi:hypothetical protein